MRSVTSNATIAEGVFVLPIDPEQMPLYKLDVGVQTEHDVIRNNCARGQMSLVMSRYLVHEVVQCL
jgi:hypothetical protein